MNKILLTLIGSLLVPSFFALAQEQPDMQSVNKLVGEVEAALAKSPAPPEGMDTEQAVKAAEDLGIHGDKSAEIIIVEDTGLSSDMVSDTKDEEVTASGGDRKSGPPASYDGQDEKAQEEEASNPHIMSLGDPSAHEDTGKEVASNGPSANTGIGSPGIYFWTSVQKISAQECMQRAKAAFESEGMTIGNGDTWWYGAYEPRYHSYNNCLDLGNGNTLVNFTSAGWRNDVPDHLNRLTSAYNAPPGTLPKQAPYSGEVARPIPELNMWVQMRNISQQECIKRATNVLKSEGLNENGRDTWFVAGQDARFHTYVVCTDLGGGNVYVNVTSTSSQAEDLNGHRDRIVQAITK